MFLTYLPALGCAGAMVLCMRMMRGHGGGEKAPEPNRLAELEEENARLRAKIALSSRGEPAREE
jgi:hypothetical protein